MADAKSVLKTDVQFFCNILNRVTIPKAACIAQNASFCTASFKLNDLNRAISKELKKDVNISELLRIIYK